MEVTGRLHQGARDQTGGGQHCWFYRAGGQNHGARRSDCLWRIRNRRGQEGCVRGGRREGRQNPEPGGAASPGSAEICLADA